MVSTGNQRGGFKLSIAVIIDHLPSRIAKKSRFPCNVVMNYFCFWNREVNYESVAYIDSHKESTPHFSFEL